MRGAEFETGNGPDSSYHGPCPKCKELQAEIERLKEKNYMKLAAISTAALQNTEKSKAERITTENPFWSVAYADVCDAIDREMKLIATQAKLVSYMERNLAMLRYFHLDYTGSDTKEDGTRDKQPDYRHDDCMTCDDLIAGEEVLKDVEDGGE